MVCVLPFFNTIAMFFCSLFLSTRSDSFLVEIFFFSFFFFEIGLKQIHGIDILFTIRKQDTRTYHDKKIEFQISQHTHSTTTKGNPCLNSSAFFRCWGYVYIYICMRPRFLAESISVQRRHSHCTQSARRSSSR